MQVHTARVSRRRALSPHLVTVTVEVDGAYPFTGVPDEYLRVLLAPEGHPLVLPTVSDDWEISQPEGTEPPIWRVYTISDHRVVGGPDGPGTVEIDLDIALHDAGPGAAWARECRPGDEIGLLDPKGLYAAPADVAWQLLVADLTGVPAMARILRGLQPGQRVRAVGVLTDAADAVALPSPADVDLEWVVVERDVDVTEALERAVLETALPGASDAGRYVWFAGEARASRTVRKHLRRTLGWPQSDFYTCGYWQIEAEKWRARYDEVADQVQPKVMEVQALAATDEGQYLDALEEIYESVGL
ncbi:MAG: siderophore-interacting protein [Aeromicrobium sp.]|uniref:siderophore-interacting protein n=1 Tax=Aeromicrobium sp. TaxID=1871063 RepID=UPI002625753C|nr:siderophore-interacting protein [Aeromicrobium sp.]MDF1706119.1 siderophore-interacting protein [Aeromicrobium sp.]